MGSEKFKSKKFWVKKKILVQRNIGLKKCPQKLRSELFQVQTNFGSKKCWVQNFLEKYLAQKKVNKNLGPTFKVWSKLTQ